MTRTKISIDRDTILSVLRELHIIVPALDRIGSEWQGHPRERFDRLLSDFMIDWNVTTRLANARAALSSLFDYDELEHLFGEIETWSISKPKPPRGSSPKPPRRKGR